MKLEKAIELLDYSLKKGTLLVSRDDLDAIKLGLEALKRIQLGRRGVQRFAHNLLPGETPLGDSP